MHNQSSPASVFLSPRYAFGPWALTALIATAAHPASAEVLLQQDFDHRDNGVFTTDDLRADWPSTLWAVGLFENRGNIATGRAGFDTPALRVSYPQGTVGPQANGVSFLTPFPNNETYEEATVSYDLAFEDGFDFKWGGKLPGLVGGGSTATGGNPANGTNGWSARVMFNGQGEIYQYVYHVDQPGNYGDWFFWRDENGDKISLETGRPYELKTQIVMNDPDQANGVLRSWLDGELVVDETDMRWRTTDQLAVEEFYFSSFHGGGTSNWAPRNDSYILFDNLLVTTGADLEVNAGPGDHNADGRVDQADLDLVLNNWGSDTAANGAPSGWVSNPSAIGVIDQTELDGVLNNWGSIAAPSFNGVNVPEPALAGIAAAAALHRPARRHRP